MKKVVSTAVVVCGTLVWSSAWATEPTVVLKVDQNQLNLIAQGIISLPYKDAAPLLQSLQDQVKAQAPKQIPAPAVSSRTKPDSTTPSATHPATQSVPLPSVGVKK